MREASLADAMALLEGFHEALRSRPVKTAIGPLTVTASSGLCQYHPNDHGYDSTVYRADHALYAACLLYTSPSPRDRQKTRLPSSA